MRQNGKQAGLWSSEREKRMMTSNLMLKESEELRMEHLQYNTFRGVDDDVAYYDDDDN